MDHANFKTILDHTGVKFLQYVLNYSRPIDYSLKYENFGFTEQQLKVLDSLDSLLKECYIQKRYNPSLEIDYFLIRMDQCNSEKLFNSYRRQCGGDFPSIQKEDKITEYISQKCIDYYPGLLLKQNDTNISFSTERSSYLISDSAEMEVFKEYLVGDSDLSRLIVSESDIFYRFGYLLENNIMAVNTSISLCAEIITRSFYNCCYRAAYSLTNLLDEVCEDIIRLRKIAKGEDITYSIFQGVYGLKLEGVNELKLSKNCIIRNIDGLDNPLKRINYTTSIMSAESGAGITIGCIVELKLQAKAKKLLMNTSFTARFDEFQTTMQNLKFAIVFATKSLRRPMTETFFDINSPMLSIRPCWYRTATANVSIITKTEQEEIKQWFMLLERVNLSHIKVPLRRLQFSIFERDNTEDAILDAFIAWEGMFSREQRTTYAVVNSIWKCYSKSTNILLSKRRIGKLYDLRSCLMHGNPTTHKILLRESPEDLRNEIVSIGLECLKELLKDNKLLPLSPPERVRCLLGN